MEEPLDLTGKWIMIEVAWKRMHDSFSHSNCIKMFNDWMNNICIQAWKRMHNSFSQSICIKMFNDWMNNICIQAWKRMHDSFFFHSNCIKMFNDWMNNIRMQCKGYQQCCHEIKNIVTKLRIL